jgi:uncharacterized membrane protein YqjE
MESPEVQPGEQPEAQPPPAAAQEEPAHPARELSLHLLRMLETRMDAAGIVLQAESQRLLTRLQLQILAAAAGFIAIWGGIVWLAIALPPQLRVPVLGAVVGLFVLGAVVAWLVARRMIANRELGSLSWFLEGLKKDLEVLARALSQSQPAPPEQQRSPPSDIAA